MWGCTKCWIYDDLCVARVPGDKSIFVPYFNKFGSNGRVFVVL
jgi:hypothetical protein